MIRRDLHTHTTYSDGTASPAEMVEAALGKGLTEIGISDHSYTSFDESYCMRRVAVPAYVREIAALKTAYAGRITVRCGVEQDLYSDQSTAPFDYAIGSVHYLYACGRYWPLDESAEILQDLSRTAFGGDFYALAEAYFAEVARFASRADVSIVGHFDLIAKFNEGGALFDETHPRYLAAAERSVDLLAAAGKTFEINTGAMARGLRTVPYPNAPLLAYIRRIGAPLVLSSDAHAPAFIAFAFDRFPDL